MGSAPNHVCLLAFYYWAFPSLPDGKQERFFVLCFSEPPFSADTFSADPGGTGPSLAGRVAPPANQPPSGVTG